MNSVCLIKLGITKIAVQTSSHTPTRQNSIYKTSPGRPPRPRQEDPPRPAVQGAGGRGEVGWAGGGGRRGGRLKTVHIKAQKEPANGIITMIQVQIKTKMKGPRLIRQATLPRTGRPPWPGHPGGAWPPSLRSRPALALALTRSIGNTEGYFVFGASNLGQTSPPRNR